MNQKYTIKQTELSDDLSEKTNFYVASQSGNGHAHIFDKLHGHTRSKESEAVKTQHPSSLIWGKL